MTTIQRAHPLVDGVEGDVLVTRSARDVVALDPLRADLLIAASAARRRVRLVTPAASRLTEPMRDALTAANGTWIVEDGAGAAWDGLLGVDATGREGIAASYLRAPVPEAVQLIAALSLRHRAEPGTRIGPAVEALAAAVGSAPAGWGPHEPVEHRWDRAALTRHLATRAPEEARALVVGPGVAGSTLARRTQRGVEEVLQLLLDAGPVGGSGTSEAVDAVPQRLAALADDALPLFGFMLARPGRADLTAEPFLQVPPVPVALLIGAPGVRDLGLVAPDLRDRFGALVVGRPRIPALVIPFTGTEGGWAAFERVVDHLGRDRLAAAMGPVPRRPTGRQ